MPQIHEANALPRARVLLIDDEALILRALGRILTGAGHQVDTVQDGAAAERLLSEKRFDVVFTDIHMPGIDGMTLLRRIRESNPDVSVVLLTGNPQVETAMEAVRHGALRYLVKPVDTTTLNQVVADAIERQRVIKLNKRAMDMLGADAPVLAQADAEVAFGRAIDQMWMAYQPIVHLSDKSVHAYEALVRSREPLFPNPGVLFTAAERMEKTQLLGRAIRECIVSEIHRSPVPRVFVNLHARDLLDETLFDSSSAFTRAAKSVILEITERAEVERVPDLRQRIDTLRALGFRIAVDDLGAGYAGLNSIAALEPEVVKLDMALVRNIHLEPTKQKLVKVMVSFCADMGAQVVAEGVESIEERDTLAGLGCDYFQGYLFARPGASFPSASFPGATR